MKTKKPTPSASKNVQVITLAVLLMVVSFSMGVKSAGEVQPISLIEAGSATVIPGDMDSDGVLTSKDVSIIIEIANGDRIATPAQLAADPNEDGHLTTYDALQVSKMLEVTTP